MAREASGSCGARGQQDGGASVRGASKAVARRAARAALRTSGVAAGWRGYTAGSYRPAGGGVQAGEDGDAGQEVRRPLRARGALRLRTPGARGAVRGMRDGRRVGGTQGSGRAGHAVAGGSRMRAVPGCAGSLGMKFF